MKQSLAIAYSMKKKAKKMADGGTTVVDKDTYNKNMAGSGWTPGETPEEAHKRKLEAIKKSQEYQGPQGLAEGGRVGRQRPDMEKGVHQPTYTRGSYAGNLTKDAKNGNTSIDKESLHSWAKEAHESKLAELKAMKKPNLYADGGEVDMVDRVMKKRMYSEGGRVANEEEVHADEMPNEFDDLVLDDHLEPHFEEGGNEHGDEQEAHDRSDIIARIMKSRAKKDRNPRPA